MKEDGIKFSRHGFSTAVSEYAQAVLEMASLLEMQGEMRKHIAKWEISKSASSAVAL